MEIKYNEKILVIENGLTVSVDTFSHNFYSQFNKDLMYGVNFSWGGQNFLSWEKETFSPLKVFVFDDEIFSRSTLGYFGDCVRLKDGKKMETSLMSLVIEKEWETILDLLLAELRLVDVDLVIVNAIDEKLTAIQKIFWFRIVAQISTIVPVFMHTLDIASLRLSEVKCNLLDETGMIEKYFAAIAAIQEDRFDEYVAKNLKNGRKKRKNTKKVSS